MIYMTHWEVSAPLWHGTKLQAGISIYIIYLCSERLFKSTLLASWACRWHFEKEGLLEHAETRFLQRVIHVLQLQ